MKNRLGKLTEDKLKKFIEMRNKACICHIFEFTCDAEECGFSVEELKFLGRINDKYLCWQTPFGYLVGNYNKLIPELITEQEQIDRLLISLAEQKKKSGE